MSASLASPRPDLATRILQGSGALWFVTALLGQTAFIIFILAFYGVRTFSGDWAGWNDKPLIEGHVAGDTVGNSVFALHVLLASAMTLCGLMQLIPQLRQAQPRLHRWTGRTFLTLAFVMALSGVWLTLGRGTYLSSVSAAAILLDAVLILGFGALAWRNAVKRQFDSHRRWAMSTFMAASGVWFLRVGLMGWVLLNQGPVGMNDTLSGPADVGLVFGCYLIPLAVLELYFLAGHLARSEIKLGTAFLITGAALYTALGSAGAIALMWWPYL